MTAVLSPPRPDRGPKPMVVAGRSVGAQILWGWGLGWTDLGLAAGFYPDLAHALARAGGRDG